jgi:hypothetical protein
MTHAESLMNELEQLVRTAARRPDLTFRAGKPGCNWSFNWKHNLVTVDPVDVQTLAPDICRGLALHEASHAAVTVFHRIMPSAQLKQLMPLLNAVEDIRIETWMRQRFPGAAAWVRGYNDLLYGRMREMPLPGSRQAAFLRGILELWWFGTLTLGMQPEVTDGLARCLPAIAAATGCQPPLENDQAAILASQRAMWSIVQERILPVWRRLVALDRREGIPRIGTGAVTRHRIRSSGPRERISEHLRPDGTEGYVAAWTRVGAEADRLGDELLQVLVPRRRLRWSAGHPSGTRLCLRRAMQSETDPRHSHSLWQRPLLPNRSDPAIALLIDRSRSMRCDKRIHHTFEAMVLLVEVCRRVGVPAAVWSFADCCRKELDWNEPLDATARHRLSCLPASCTGSTAMGRALDTVNAAYAAHHGDPKLLFILSDGEPNSPDPVHKAVARLEQHGVATIGLGLGEGTNGLSAFFQTSLTEIHPSELVTQLGRLVKESLTEKTTR